MIDYLEYIGAACAIAGSFWLTHKWPGYVYGWVVFLVASVTLVVFFISKGYYAAFAMELVFVYTNLIGIKTWILKKA